MNEGATASAAVPDITPRAVGQRKDTTGNSGAIPNGLNCQSVEFTDLACYKRLEEHQEKELTAGLNQSSAEALFAIRNVCPQIPGLILKIY